MLLVPAPRIVRIEGDPPRGVRGGRRPALPGANGGGSVDRGSIATTFAPSEAAGTVTLTQECHVVAPVAADQAAETTPSRRRHTLLPRGASFNHGIGLNAANAEHGLADGSAVHDVVERAHPNAG